MEMGAYADATQVGFGSIRSTLFKGRLCVMSGAGGTAPFFVPCGTFLIAHDAKCSRPISFVRWIVQSRSQAFVDVRDLVMGYVMGYLPTISENKFVLVL